MAELILKDEVYSIVGAAFEVYNELGCGFLESIYQEAMEIELAARGIPFLAQAPLRIRYKNQVLAKQYIADIICFGAVLVEIKAVDQIISVHESQALNYLKATGLRVAVIINFGAAVELEWKRLVL
ncbi:MAG: GxxExxY protein [Burkholderiales bacterium]|nr:GxxExxY protein [Phycisphaerae bacterium]